MLELAITILIHIKASRQMLARFLQVIAHLDSVCIVIQTIKVNKCTNLGCRVMRNFASCKVNSANLTYSHTILDIILQKLRMKLLTFFRFRRCEAQVRWYDWHIQTCVFIFLKVKSRTLLSVINWEEYAGIKTHFKIRYKSE